MNETDDLEIDMTAVAMELSQDHVDTKNAIRDLIDKYHRLKQEAHDETTDQFELGQADAYGRIIHDLEEIVSTSPAGTGGNPEEGS